MRLPDILGHTHELGVRWRGFRGFEDSGWLHLKPLTILIGPNSTGKSSLLEPLLLLKQSLRSQTGRNALSTRGDYVDSGSFPDFAHRHRPGSSVDFELRWHSHRKAATAPVGSFPPGGARFSFQQGEAPETIALQAYRLYDTHRRSLLTRVRTKTGRYSVRLQDARATSGKEDPKLRAAMRASRPVDFLFTSRPVRNAAVDSESDDAPFTFRLDDPQVLLYCQAVDYAEWQLQDLADRIYYLGPLREPPRRVYELSGEMPPDVGTRGEFAPEIAFRSRTDRAWIRRLQRWLKRFDIDETLVWDAIGGQAFSMLLREGSKKPTSFADMGFGMSQVLPLIVQGLRAPRRSWIITEQPEIHLNPRLQAELADLFVDFAARDRAVLVETHSEHFLLRLRSLIAGGSIPPESVALYYVEKDKGVSSVRGVPIEDSGRVDPKEWPKGFFEDSLREALTLARAQASANRS